jgi:putative glutamine amidotransferase
MHKPLIGIGSDLATKNGERDRAFVYTTYIESLKRAGAVPVLIPPQPENAADVLDGLDGLVLAGGDDCDPSVYGETKHPSSETMDPRRQKNDLGLARAARDRGVPTLGICLGVQVMNVAAGGTLIQDIASAVDTDIDHASEPTDRHRHEVHIDASTKLGHILGAQELNVNSSHHQAVGRVAEGLRVTAQAPDGIIEALEDPSHPFYIGVQWHPEDMPGESSATALFGAFVDAARKHAREKENASTNLSPVGAAQSE